MSLRSFMDGIAPQFEKGGRPELAAKEKQEIVVIESDPED